VRRRGFYIPEGLRLVTARPALDWDRYLAEAKEAREKREAAIAETEKHHQPDVAGEGS